jgi:hypothetical protein
MVRQLVIALAVVVASAAGFAGRPVAQTADVGTAFAAYWAASSPEDAAREVDPIVRSGVTFDEAYRRLQRGRSYIARETGVVRLENRTSDGVQHFYSVTSPRPMIPPAVIRSASVARRSAAARAMRQSAPARLARSPVPSRSTSSYAYDAPWWSNDQVLNLAAIVDV